MDLRMSSISQHISPQSDSQWGNEHHIWCNRHGFQPETTYPAFRRAAFCRSILSSPPESWPIEICCTLFDSAQNVSLIHLCGVMALLSDSFPFTVR